MDLCNEVVRHKAFGTGRIVEFSNNYITVLFDETNTKRQFVYPTAFGEFLILENKAFSEQIEHDKSLIAQELEKNKRANEAFARAPKPVEPKKAKARPKKVAAAKSPE